MAVPRGWATQDGTGDGTVKGGQHSLEPRCGGRGTGDRPHAALADPQSCGSGPGQGHPRRLRDTKDPGLCGLAAGKATAGEDTFVHGISGDAIEAITRLASAGKPPRSKALL